MSNSSSSSIEGKSSVTSKFPWLSIIHYTPSCYPSSFCQTHHARHSITPVQLEENPCSDDLDVLRLRATDDNVAAKLIKKRLGNTTALRRRRFILTDEEKEEARRKNTTARRRHRALLSVEGSALVKEKDIASMDRDHVISDLTEALFLFKHLLMELIFFYRSKKKTSQHDRRRTRFRTSKKCIRSVFSSFAFHLLK